jgi:hypothetical protein
MNFHRNPLCIMRIFTVPGITEENDFFLIHIT